MKSLKIFKDTKIKAFFTTRSTGSEISEICIKLGIPKNSVYLPLQRHTDNVQVLHNDQEPKIADAVITNRMGILIGVQVADCVPILLYDKKRHIVGAVHAGWRGTAAGILKNTIKAMMDSFSSSPRDILVAFGPSIRWCCYGVGYEVIDAIEKITGKGEYYIKRGDKYYLDLQSANKYQLLSMGVPTENIGLSDECTFCLPEKYFSYRFAKGATGRQYGLIGIL